MIKKCSRIGSALFSLLSLFLGYFFFGYGEIKAQEIFWTSEPSLGIEVANNYLFYHQDSLVSVAGSSTFVTDRVFNTVLQPNGTLSNWTDLLVFPKQLFWYSGLQQENTFYILGGAEWPNSTVVSTSAVYKGLLENTGIAEWKELTSIPLALAEASAVKIDDYLFLSGGGVWSGGGPTIKNVIYRNEFAEDGDLGPWDPSGVLPRPMLGHHMIYTGTKLFLISGFDGSEYKTTGKVFLGNFDFDKNITSWVLQGDLELPLKTYANMIVRAGDYVIIAGGRGPSLDSSTVYDEIYYSRIDGEGTLGPWQLSSIRLPKKLCCAGIATNGDKVYLTGGHDGRIYFSDVWSIDVDTIINGAPSTPTPYPTPENTPTTIPTLTPTLTPTPIPEIAIPLVFVPGMGASWNHDAIVEKISVPNEGWTMAPYAKETYRGLFMALGSAGYVQDNNFFIYYYDWRKDVRYNAAALRNFINTRVLAGKPEGTQVDLAGHSMGGLISRSAAGDDFAPKVHRVITLGSPHNGAALAYQGWEGAEISGFTGFTRISLQTALGVASAGYQSPVSFIQTQIPSVQNLLPGWEYLKNKHEVYKPLDKMIWQNNLLPDLREQEDEVLDKLGTIGGLGSQSHQTITVDKQTQRDIVMGRWVDGRPIAEQTADGDGTVLAESAIAPGSWRSDLINGTDHGQLCSESSGQLKLLQYLGKSGDEAVTYPKPYHKAVVVTLGSPAVFSLILPDGTIVYPENEIVTLDDPQPGVYRVKTVGTAPGKATIYFGRINGSDTAWNVREIQIIGAGEIQISDFFVNLGSTSLGANPLAEADLYLQKINLRTVYPPVLPFIAQISRLMEEIADNQPPDAEITGVRILRAADQAIAKNNRFYSQDLQTTSWLRLIKLNIDQYLTDLAID